MPSFQPRRGYLGSDLSRRVRRSASFEPVVDTIPSDSEESNQDLGGGKDGGARLAATPSPSMARSLPHRAASDGAPVSPRRESQGPSFQIDTNREDDVFADETGPGDAPQSELSKALSKMRVGSSEHSRSTSVDAQNIYPQTACVFVGNLSSTADDATLLRSVEATFSAFGRVFVKIRRDSRNMPFAFAQFTNDRDAGEAVRHGRNQNILGRACRTEFVRAHTSWVVFRHDGGPVIPEEATRLLEPLSEISRAEPLPNDAARQLRIPNGGILVHYLHYDAERQVLQLFVNDSVYGVRAFEPPRSNDRMVSLPRLPCPPRAAPTETDEYSVYFGNLPLNLDVREFAEMINSYGSVINIDLQKRTVAAGTMTAYAFVEFANIDSVQSIIHALNGVEFRGKAIKVEPKRYKTVSPTRQYHGSYRRGDSYSREGVRYGSSSRGAESLQELFRPNRHAEAPSDQESSGARCGHVLSTPEGGRFAPGTRPAGRRLSDARPHGALSPVNYGRMPVQTANGTVGLVPIYPHQFGPVTPHGQPMVYHGMVGSPPHYPPGGFYYDGMPIVTAGPTAAPTPREESAGNSRACTTASVSGSGSVVAPSESSESSGDTKDTSKGKSPASESSD